MDPTKYFSYFRYVPTKQEYLKFFPNLVLPKKIRLVKNRVVNKNNEQYLVETLKKREISQKKLAKRLWLLKTFSKLDCIRYLGISGTVSMNNAQEKDDLDIFIITKQNRLWTARFSVLALGSLFNARRTFGSLDYQDKLCFNLFFAENDLKIRKSKQTMYVAHEILQLKTIVNKEAVFEKLLLENSWVFKKFPHAKMFYKIPDSSYVASKTKINWLEKFLAKWQLKSINKRKTNEIITKTQLWFFPIDFEKKLPFK